MDIATIIGLMGTLTLILNGSGLSMWLNVPSLIFVFFSTFFLTLCSYPLPNVIHAIQSIAYAFWWPYTIAESVKSVIADPVKVRTRLQNGIIVLERMKTLAQATGWFGVLIGGIHILTRWKEFEDNAEIGLALSFCLLTGLYGTFLAYVVFFPLSIKLQTRLDELRET